MGPLGRGACLDGHPFLHAFDKFESCPVVVMVVADDRMRSDTLYGFGVGRGHTPTAQAFT